MKSILSVWLLLFCVVSAPACLGQSTDTPPRFSVQKTVVYPVQDPDRLPPTIAWYTAFFGQQPTAVDMAPPYPHAVYHIDGVEVRLETDPRFLKLKETVFYWVLPTSQDVEAKFNALDADKTNRFERNLFQRMRKLEAPRPDQSSRGTAETVTEVSEFIVVDPAGNPVGVINNPVYPPKVE